MSLLQPPYGVVPSNGGLGAGAPLAWLDRFMPADPLYGASLNTGPTGLGGLTGAGVNPGDLARLRAPAGLAAQVPAGAGAQALQAANALRPAAEVATAAGGGGGRLGGVGSRLAGAFGEGGALRPVAPTGVRGWAGLGGRALAGAGTGLFASGLVDQLNPGGQNSNIEQALQGAAIGAGLGSVVPGVGTATGALVGAVGGGALGVLTNMFGGGDEEEAPEPVEVLGRAIQAANLDPAYTEEILTTYDVLKELAMSQPEGEARDTAMQQALDQTSQMVLMAMQEQQQAQQMVPKQVANTLALQNQAQQIFEPLASDIEQNALLYGQAMAANRDRLPPEQQAITDATVAREMTSANKLADAYRAQAAITPAVQALTQYQQDFNSYASQLFQQQLAAAASGQAGGGQVDMASLLAGMA